MLRRNDWKQAKLKDGTPLLTVCSGDENVFLCVTKTPEDADFIASHLNLAANLKQHTGGGCDGCELVKAARKIEELLKKQRERTDTLRNIASKIRIVVLDSERESLRREYNELSMSPISFEDAIVDLLDALKTVKLPEVGEMGK